MSGELKTIQWNIGGGKILADGQDPNLISSYTEEGMGHVIDIISQHEPDIITLQEVHQPQPAEIASALGYGNLVTHDVSPSHIDSTQRLGHGLISKFPVKFESFRFLDTPDWVSEDEDGAKTPPHEKGVSTYELRLDDQQILVVQNIHLFPFRRFGINHDSPEAGRVLREVEKKVGRFVGKRLLQGDFNLNSQSLQELLPGLFESEFDEVAQTEETTPTGKHIDHVLFAGMTVVKSVVIKDVLTDHFPIVTTFTT